MYDLKLSGNVAEQNLYLDTILQLEELRHLDVSFGNNDETYFDTVVLNSKLRLSDLMLHFTALPKLVSLDISGIYSFRKLRHCKVPPNGKGRGHRPKSPIILIRCLRRNSARSTTENNRAKIWVDQMYRDFWTWTATLSVR